MAQQESKVRVKLATSEALDQGLCRGIQTEGWEDVESPVGTGEALRSQGFGKPLVLLCGPETTGLQFLRHGWSGAVRISTDEGERILPLSKDDGTDDVLFELPERAQDFRVAIEALSVEGRDTARCEVWLLGLTFRKIPRPIGRSALLNRHTKLVYGNWGEFLVLATDEVIPGAIVRDGAWAADDIRLFKDHVRPGDVVLDVGANFGHHSVVFSKLVGSTGLVVAIEAQWSMYQLIHANAVLNRLDNIVPIHAAAGNNHGSVTMYPVSATEENNFGRLGINPNAFAGGDDGEEVAVYPLDALLPDYLNGRPVAFVKIDVQAYELFVLQGMVSLLKQHKPTIFVEIAPYWMKRAGYDYNEIYALLRAHGYRFIHRDGVALGSDGISEIPGDQDIEWDLLAIHDDGAHKS
jgi:FkbM family methyltransferase